MDAGLYHFVGTVAVDICYGRKVTNMLIVFSLKKCNYLKIKAFKCKKIG